MFKIRSLKNAVVLCVLYALSGYTPALAQAVPELRPLRIDQDFDIDGQLSNPAWQQADEIQLTHQNMPVDNKPAPVKTTAKVLYSENFLYVGFTAYDPDPSQIRAHITDRDEFGMDDNVGIILDPFMDNQNAVQFFVNPRGIQLDVKRSGSIKNTDYDMLWYSAAEINNEGYTAVMKIPFTSFHFPKGRVQDWSIQFVRKYSRSVHYEFSWSYIPLGDPCILCHSGRLTGITDIKNNNPIDIIPYVMGYQNSELKNPADPASGLKHNGAAGRLGGTVTYSPNTGSSLDITINPDFSQVESDATEISVNNTFAIQYPEKRTFFLKNAEIFETGDMQSFMKNYLFFSRTINQPWVAAKYTHTTSRANIGFMTAYDRNSPYIVPGLLESNTVENDIEALNNILRAKINVGRQSYIGGTATARNHLGGDDDAHNYAGSLDWNMYLGNKFYFDGLAAYSQTKEINDTTLFNSPRNFGGSRYDAAFNGEEYAGTYLSANVSRKAKIYTASASYTSLSPTFQAQNGFVTRIDRRTYGLNQQLNYYPDSDWISHGSFSANANWRYDFSNVFKERFLSLNWANNFPGQTRFSINHFIVNDETFRGVFFEGLNRTTLEFSTRPSLYFNLSSRFETGKSIYRIQNPKLGTGYNYTVSANLQPGTRIKLDLSYNYSTLSDVDTSDRFYSGSISRLAGYYSFTHHLFFRLITQYDSFSKQLQIYPLVYYKPNPFTRFYVGMTDNLQHVNRIGPPQINGYRQTHREFFVKMQFLIQR